MPDVHMKIIVQGSEDEIKETLGESDSLILTTDELTKLRHLLGHKEEKKPKKGK